MVTDTQAHEAYRMAGRAHARAWKAWHNAYEARYAADAPSGAATTLAAAEAVLEDSWVSYCSAYHALTQAAVDGLIGAYRAGA